MKTILVEFSGDLNHVDIPELDVSYYLGGAPLTFCGTIPELDIVILIKEDSLQPLNTYRIPGIKSFNGRALIVQTDDEGAPIDINFDKYYEYEKWYNQPIAHSTRLKHYKKI